jgi:predicted kinase
MPVMYILRGIPASGKSTWRREQGLRYVNRDELRLQFPEKKEREITALQDTIVQSYIDDGVDFIIDNTHIHTRSYQKYIDRAAGYTVEIKEFSTSLYECLANNELRDAKVPFSIILKMAHDIGWYENELRFYFCGNKDKQRAIIVDLDGTLCNIAHRRHHVLENPKNWKAFFDGICDDTPNLAVLDIIQMYDNDPSTLILLVSGRPEDYRTQTEAWLEEHNVPYEWLLMRPFNNKEDDTIVKAHIYDTYIKPYFNVLFCIDDRRKIGRVWHQKGLNVLMYGDPDENDF